MDKSGGFGRVGMAIGVGVVGIVGVVGVVGVGVVGVVGVVGRLKTFQMPHSLLLRDQHPALFFVTHFQLKPN